MVAPKYRVHPVRQVALPLAAALLACTASACTAPHELDDPIDPIDLGTSDGSNTSDGSDDSIGSDGLDTGAEQPAGDCEFDSASIPVDCAQITRIIPTGVGVSEAHVARRHLRLEDTSGAALGPEFQACLVVTDSACEAVPVELEPAPSRTITALLVRPEADPMANAALADALTSFIDARPEGEQIGVFRWGAQVTQISTPTADKSRLHRLVASGLQPLDTDSMPLAEAVDAVDDPLVSDQRDSHLSLRQLFVVAPGHAPVEANTLELSGYTAPLRVELVANDDVEAALLDASERLDDTIDAGELLIRQCGLDGLVGLTVHTAGGGPTLTLADVFIAGADQLAGTLSCDPADQGIEPTPPDIIEIELSPTELLDHEARVADLSKEPFYGSVHTNLNAPGISAQVRLKLRGQGSLSCERKSLSLNFTDDLSRQWLPDSGTDRFFLISMCKDDRYVSQFTANLLMAEHGLFAPKFRMVELKFNGESQGAYLLVEKPQTALELKNTHPRVIVRRRKDAQGAAPELKYAAGDEAEALAAYEKLISQAEALSGNELIAWLDQAMDLDQYLRWIALMTVLHSGDFVDEVYFMSTEVTGPDASASDYFSISTWDQDDILKPCHKSGENAMDDPHGMIYCAEARLDFAIFSEPKIYERFANELEQTMAWLDQDTFDAAMHASEDSVLGILARDDARAAMVELLDDVPAAIDYDVAEQEVLERGAELRDLFADRRAELIELLDDYTP